MKRSELTGQGICALQPSATTDVVDKSTKTVQLVKEAAPPPRIVRMWQASSLADSSLLYLL
jgi:hypothetical protein